MRVLWNNLALRIGALVLLSAGITAAICKFDSTRQVSNQTAFALRWARQIATQGETLTLTASEKGEVDPLNWAARLLTQGTDSRILFVSKFHDEKFEQISRDEVEHYSLDSKSGVFDYTKILYPQDGMGLKIQLFTARVGIFGAKTRLGQDFTMGVIFLVAFGFLNLLSLVLVERVPYLSALRGEKSSKKDTVVENDPVQAQKPDPSPLKALVLEWITHAKDALTQLSIHIREMTRSAQKISSAAVESRQHLASVREKMHLQLTLLHDVAKKQDLADLAGKAERIFKKADPETQLLIKRLLESALNNAEITSALELQLEGAVIDCDHAFHALKDVGDFAQVMGKEIKATTQGILGQSQMMSELKNRGA
jgi:hypothetical protein